MKIEYFPETDTLYLDLANRPSADSREASPGIVLDYDASGNVVGIEIDEATQRLDLTELVLAKLPVAAPRWVA